ncbi:MAG: RluA family pseudouridine synthase, partial [Fusobacteriaceae bacterium]
GKDQSKIKCGLKLKGKEKIVIEIPEDEILDLTPENIPLDIIFEDSDIIVINKAAGMVVHPAYGNYSGTLVNALLYHIKDLSSINGIIRPGIVHRLDKDTSGVIIVAKNDIAHIKLSEMFKEKTLDKIYVCICKGNFRNKKDRIESLIARHTRDRKKMAVSDENGRNAITNYEVIDEVQGFSMVKVKIETGRTHQIRVHMKYLNHPILGDSVYGNSDVAKRQMLHAYILRFEHPITNQKLEMIAPLPEDFLSIAKKLHLDTEKILEKNQEKN